MKYKVGDRVVVRSDLQVGKTYYMDDGENRNSLVVDMKKFVGCVVTICYVGSQYHIKEDSFNWTDEMFEGLADDVMADTIDVTDLI